MWFRLAPQLLICFASTMRAKSCKFFDGSFSPFEALACYSFP
jgi:hypothetical protein